MIRRMSGSEIRLPPSVRGGGVRRPFVLAFVKTRTPPRVKRSRGRSGPSARALLATFHAAGENFIRIMSGVAQAIEEVLRSGHVPRARSRLFAIQVGVLVVVSARRCFQRTSRHSLTARGSDGGNRVGA